VATACDGSTLTDQVNCLLPGTLGTYSKTASGITAVAEPISIISTPGVSTIGLQLIAMQYVDGANNAYEFYEVNSATASFRNTDTVRSLHSNRGYEVGIVYMDEYNRSSTALVSPNNTIQIPCANSINKNELQVTIPPQQLAPSWATRYKFVLKPTETTYDTIYSSIYFQDPGSNATYFLLEGENANKVEEGDRYFVKSDSNGPILRCVEATVLEKENKSADFITPSNGSAVPSGTYMKINPNNFSTVREANDIITPGSKTEPQDTANQYPILAYPMNLDVPDPAIPGSTHTDYNVPAGSRIVMSIRQERLGPGQGNGKCERRISELNVELVSSTTYDNMQDWWNGDNVEAVLNDAVTEVGGNTGSISNVYEPATAATKQDISTSEGTNYYKFFRDTATNELALLITGTVRCGGTLSREKRRSTVTADIQIYRADSIIAFETQPTDALDNVWYENHLSFDVSADGMHSGNVQTQTSSLPAIIDTEFSDCFAFGNGVESYKILDSIVGKTKNIGERVTSTSNMDYKESHRFADLTYSGVYNDETNVNKLNEFNLGLLNFKPLEDSYGPIQLLDGRKTDILTLQEDKISYVLAGKNLLSDATGGGAVTSVPEVLGTQIARLEDYGISENPESYASYGPNKYFTDAKRGAVINLIGGAYNNEQLQVISEAGMRSWFRDLFIDTFTTQKMGGFDPYMNEYVLHSNVQLPQPVVECVDCNSTKNITINPATTFTYCVNVGDLLGIVDIDFTIPTGGFTELVSELNDNIVSERLSDEIVSENDNSTTGYTITATYNGVSHTTGTVYDSGTLSFNKNDVNTDTVEISVTQDSSVASIIDINTSCPDAQTITIISVAVTSNSDAGDFITNEFRWTDGTFTSPTKTYPNIEFSSGTNAPIVSLYNQVTGQQGGGFIPGDAANVSIISRKRILIILILILIKTN